MTTRRQRSRAQHRTDVALAVMADQHARAAEFAARVDGQPYGAAPAAPDNLPAKPGMRMNYRGDVTDVDRRQVLGPDLYGAHYRVVGAEYDAAADYTTLAFRAITRGGSR